MRRQIGAGKRVPSGDARRRTLRLAATLVAGFGVVWAARFLLAGYWTYSIAVLAMALLFAALILPWSKGAGRSGAARSGWSRGEVRDEVRALFHYAFAAFGLFSIASLVEFGLGVVFDDAGRDTIRHYTILVVFLPVALLAAWGERRRRRASGGARG